METENPGADREEGIKNPCHEAEHPAPAPKTLHKGRPFRPRNHDPAGQQGGTRGDGRDGSPPP